MGGIALLLLLLLPGIACRHNPPSVLPPSGASGPAPSAPLFRDMADAVGLHFQHYSGATKQKYFPEIMGSGVAILDYNNDGAYDVFVVQGDLVDPHQRPEDVLFPWPAGQKHGCRLFRNDLSRTGKLHFTDVTEQAGLVHLAIRAGMGVAVGDYDNDGFPDLYVTGYGHSVLLHNNGNGTFTDVTRQAGVGDDGNWATSAAFVDYDQDGKLDLVVTNYVDFTVAKNQKCVTLSKAPDYCGPTSYKPVAPRLYHNLGGGRFADVTQTSHLGSVRGDGLGVACADFDGDGWPDIFIANDQTANTLWINKHNGVFQETAVLAGCAYGPLGYPQANMGLAVGDIDNKGVEDVLITHLASEGAMLFRNDGKANFRDASAEAGLRDPTFKTTGFGTDWFDYDNDGLLDLFIANGAVATDETQRGAVWPFQQNNQLFHNEGAGKGFKETTQAGGTDLSSPGVGRGVAFGDLNNDGHMDIVVTNNNGPLRLLLNQANTPNHWLEVRLEGVQCNRTGLGAKVAIVHKGQNPIWRRCHTDGSYGSASDARVHFGLGADPTIQSVLVQWPHGTLERWDNVRADRQVTLRQGTGKRQ
ncbi:MAG: hypothetical protein JWL77_5588 [Chthonomonadaceae bacterium]|nr:hypothetical protein [Chthonomonadaceae bacterium]